MSGQPWFSQYFGLHGCLIGLKRHLIRLHGHLDKHGCASAAFTWHLIMFRKTEITTSLCVSFSDMLIGKGMPKMFIGDHVDILYKASEKTKVCT
jgi:hypothetical protein